MKFDKMRRGLKKIKPKDDEPKDPEHVDDEIVNVCAWCKKVVSRKKVPKDQAMVTHGICHDCKDDLLRSQI
jgi:hypothetical protein